MPDKAHYSFLNEADWENPFIALEEIFERYNLSGVLHELSDFYRAALESEAWKGDDPLKKSGRLWFFQTTLYLYEAAHRINELGNNGEIVLM